MSLEASSSAEQLQRLELQHALDSSSAGIEDPSLQAEQRSVESTLLLPSHSLDSGPASPSKQNQSKVSRT